jgi:hypothetical protein
MTRELPGPNGGRPLSCMQVVSLSLLAALIALGEIWTGTLLSFFCGCVCNGHCSYVKLLVLPLIDEGLPKASLSTLMSSLQRTFAPQ